MIRYAGGIRQAGRQSRAGVAGFGIVLCVALVAGAAVAQDTRSEPPSNVIAPPSVTTPSVAPVPPAQPVAPPPAAEPPPADYKPGFIDAFGRFIGDSAAKLNSQLKSANDTLGSQLKSANETLGDLGNQTGEAAKGAVGTAKDAAGTIIGLPSTRTVTGRERCAAAANGAPDCRAAADAACRHKGFASGRLLDTQSTRKCPLGAFLSGRFPAEGDCSLETVVTRAVCQ
ncbi:MAG TPA: hypothetical protein VIY51_16995 [Xanthobacteraceae bacterium]